MPHRFPRVSLIVQLALLSACAQQPVAAIAPPAATPPPAPAPAPDARAEGQVWLNALRQRFARSGGYTAEVASASEGTWDDGADTGVRRTTRNRARLSWSKPARLHGEMLEAPFALMVGGTMDTTDGETLTLRPKGLLSVIGMTVKATDVKLRSARNHPFRDSHPAAQLARLSDAGAVWAVVAQTREQVTIEVTGVRRLDAGIEREFVTIRRQDAGLVAIAMHAGGRQVAQSTFKDFRWR